MEINLIQQLTATFEGHAQQTDNGVEYWLARDLQQLLGYAEWRNFHQTAISKAKTAIESSTNSYPSEQRYKANTLDEVEKDYLKTISSLEKLAKKATHKKANDS